MSTKHKNNTNYLEKTAKLFIFAADLTQQTLWKTKNTQITHFLLVPYWA